MRKLLLFAVLLVLAAGCRNRSTEPDLDAQYAATLIAQGETVPDFTLNDLEGRPVRLSDFRGRTVVLAFWASW